MNISKPSNLGVAVRGQEISRVSEGSHAWLLGVRPGWRVVEVGGVRVKGTIEVTTALATCKRRGTPFSITFQVPRISESQKLATCDDETPNSPKLNECVGTTNALQQNEGNFFGEHAAQEVQQGAEITPVERKSVERTNSWEQLDALIEEVEQSQRGMPGPVQAWDGLVPDSVLEQYEILQELGRGTFGVVVLAKHHQTQEAVAVKLLTGLVSKAQRDLALREARLLKAARSQHVVHVHQWLREPTAMVIVMEYCAGGRLSDHIIQHKPSLEEARNLITQILTAVDYLHCTLNIVHRDLKPENILLARPLQEPQETPLLKLADFGLANYFQSTKVMKSFCGTPHYLAPEVRDGTGYSRAVDLWSVGQILHLLTLRKLLAVDRRFNADEVADSIPCAAVELLSALLTEDPLIRMTAKEALSQPWITGDESWESRPSLMTMLKEYRLQDPSPSPNSTALL